MLRIVSRKILFSSAIKSHLSTRFLAVPSVAYNTLTSMETKTIKVDLDADQPEQVDAAVKLLSVDEVIAIPTETVYGLAGNALSSEAVRKIFAAKGRPGDNPLIVHISSFDQLKLLLPEGQTIPEAYAEAVRIHWPGPLTIILPRRDDLPSSVTAGQPTVAVRFPAHPLARALISRCGFPLAAPSANLSGRPSPTTAAHVLHDLNGKIPLILDGGACDVGVESTVLDALRSPPAILRPGGITYEQLARCEGLRDLQVYRRDFVDAALEAAPTTPGMKYRHYSPDAEVVLLDYSSDSTSAESATPVSALRRRRALENTFRDLCSARPTITSVAVLRLSPEWLPTEEPVECTSGEVCVWIHDLGDTPEDVARNIFSALREADDRKVDLILVEGVFDESQIGMAVMNRLRKAASMVVRV